MAKKIEVTPIKKKKGEFNLIGEISLNDYSFGIDLTSDKSDWKWHEFKPEIYCGEKHGTIAAKMNGGFGTKRSENFIYNVHGKTEKLDENNEVIKDQKGNIQYQDDFSSIYNLVWEDRNDKEILDTIGDMCFFTVGLEKDENDKTIYKKFLTPYDAIPYIKEHIEEGMVVNIKGDLTFSTYQEQTQVTKEIKSIVLSKAKPEQYKATFTQTIIVNKDSVQKIDKEELWYPIEAYVPQYYKMYNNQLVKKTLPQDLLLFLPVTKETVEKVKKILKFFKAKTGKYTRITVEGYFIKTGKVETVEVAEADLDQDILDLIEAGLIDRETVIGKVAFVNGGKTRVPERMIITSPLIHVDTETGSVSIDREADMYTDDDLDIELIIADAVKNNSQKEVLFDKDKDNESNKETDDDDDSWLNDL